MNNEGNRGTRRVVGFVMVDIEKLLELEFNFLILIRRQMVRRGIRKRNTKNEVDTMLNRTRRWKAFRRGKHIKIFRENNKQIMCNGLGCLIYG